IRGTRKPSELFDEEINELAVPAIEILRSYSEIVGYERTPVPLALARNVVEAELEIRAICEGKPPEKAMEELMRRRDEAFGGRWDGELPETRNLPSLERAIRARMGSGQTRGEETPAFPLTRVRPKR